MCMTTAEAFSSDCQGLVFELPCPESYVAGMKRLKFQLTNLLLYALRVADNFVVGNFAVVADPTFGGGSFNVSGSAVTPEGSYVQFQMLLNQSTFSVSSSGTVGLAAGNSSLFNGVGSGVAIAAGSGVNRQGGSGGGIVLQAGSGVGEEQFGGESGTGGNVQIIAGSAVEGTGGGISVVAGPSMVGDGGMLSMVSGPSVLGSSGDALLQTGTSIRGTSGASDSFISITNCEFYVTSGLIS
jgi:hypothetical protein